LRRNRMRFRLVNSTRLDFEVIHGWLNLDKSPISPKPFNLIT
jgi:hypothetical protein